MQVLDAVATLLLLGLLAMLLLACRASVPAPTPHMLLQPSLAPILPALRPTLLPTPTLLPFQVRPHTYADLRLGRPICTPQPAGRWLCLGWLENLGEQAWGQIRLRLNETSFAILQRWLAPQQRAPYQVLLEQAPDMLAISVLSADSRVPSSIIQPPSPLENISLDIRPHFVTLHATLHHNAPPLSARFAIHAMLIDAADALVAYQVFVVASGDEVGRTTPIALTLLPAPYQAPLRYALYAETLAD